MALGFAAYILFMKCKAGTDGKFAGNLNGKDYSVNDDKAGYFAENGKPMMQMR